MNDKTEGVYFAVWAPNAKNVSVVGEFNDWNLERDRMERQEPLGIYVKFVPEAKEDSFISSVLRRRKASFFIRQIRLQIMRSFVRERRLVLRIFPV